MKNYFACYIKLSSLVWDLWFEAFPTIVKSSTNSAKQNIAGRNAEKLHLSCVFKTVIKLILYLKGSVLTKS
jgi:hypothetical protein